MGKDRSKLRKASENYDCDRVNSDSYNDYAGAKKVVPAGHFYESRPISDIAWSLDASAGLQVGKGVIVACFNSAAVVHSVAIGDSTLLAAIPVGTVDLVGRVGIAIAPYSWTYINTYDQDWIFTDNNAVFCYIVADDTYLQ